MYLRLMAKVGRPTSYKPEYCDSVIECMAQGFSLTAFAGSILVARSSINNWMAEHPEFLEATKVGQAARTFKLEKGLYAAKSGPEATAHIFGLKNADPDGWRERVQNEHTGPNGGAIVQRIERVIVDPKDG
jgi:hypothetical protein